MYVCIHIYDYIRTDINIHTYLVTYIETDMQTDTREGERERDSEREKHQIFCALVALRLFHIFEEKSYV